MHVAGWAKRFLFRAEQLDTAVSRLSGGEKARIVLARLMLQPADLRARVLALDGRGGAEFFADYEQWKAEGRGQKAEVVAPPVERPLPLKAKRLSYIEQREWDQMEETLLAAEERLAEAQRRVEDPAIAADADALQQRHAELEAAQSEVDRLYTRWAELEQKRV